MMTQKKIKTRRVGEKLKYSSSKLQSFFKSEFI